MFDATATAEHLATTAALDGLVVEGERIDATTLRLHYTCTDSTAETLAWEYSDYVPELTEEWEEGEVFFSDLMQEAHGEIFAALGLAMGDMAESMRSTVAWVEQCTEHRACSILPFLTIELVPFVSRMQVWRALETVRSHWLEANSVTLDDLTREW